MLFRSKAMVAQQQAQQNAQDPVLQLQAQELAIKKQDSDTKAKKVAADAAAKADELALKREEMGAKMNLEGRKFVAQNEIEGVKLAGDIVKARREAAQPKEKPKK